MRNQGPRVPRTGPFLALAGSKARVQFGQVEGLDLGQAPLPQWLGSQNQAHGGSRAHEGSWRCDASEEPATPSSHSHFSFAVGAQVPGSAARAAVKARGLWAEGLGQLLHAELASGKVAGPSGRRGGLNRQVAAGGSSRAACGPGLAVAGWGRAGGGRVARRGPGADVQQRGQVLGGPRRPRRESQRGRCGRWKTLVEVLRAGFCGTGRGLSTCGAGRGLPAGSRLSASGAGQGRDRSPETWLSTPRALDPATESLPGGLIQEEG